MMIHGEKTICVAVVLVMAVTTGAWAEDPYQVEWIAQIGTGELDLSVSVAVGASGDVYITGWSTGDLGGSHLGSFDSFLSKFDSDGNEIWTSKIGTSSNDTSWSVAVDTSGNSYITGGTGGDLGGPSAGHVDAFLSKFDSDGEELWTSQIGTPGNDDSFSVALDASGNAYISGRTKPILGGPFSPDYTDVFLSKFDSGGEELWTSQIGTSKYDHSYSVALDASGNAYISGETRGNLGGFNAGFGDVFLSKFNSDGAELWTIQIGTSGLDRSHSVAVDASGNAYISGFTAGDLDGLNAGDHDAFLSKFDSDGKELWTTQIGTSHSDESWSVALDASGNAYISGTTYGDLGGPSAGGGDAFLSKFDSDGKELWTTQIGTDETDDSYSLALDASGNVYISGQTGGDFSGANAGRVDAFLVKYEVPEPATLGMLALGGLAVIRRKRS